MTELGDDTFSQSPLTQFAPWQLVNIFNEQGKKLQIVVYADNRNDSNDRDYLHHVYDITGYRLTMISGPHLHGKRHYDLDDTDSLCFGCASCTEWNCSERGCYKTDARGQVEFDKDTGAMVPLLDKNGKQVMKPFCEHIQAVIAFLKKKRELKSQNVEFEEYTAGWINRFHITKKNDESAAGSANPADDSESLPDYQNHV